MEETLKTNSIDFFINEINQKIAMLEDMFPTEYLTQGVPRIKKFDIDALENDKIISILNKAKLLLNWNITEEEKKRLLSAIYLLLENKCESNDSSINHVAAVKQIMILEAKYNILGKKLPSHRI